MEIKPILATLSRHKLIVALLALLVALTCAIVTNVAFMIQQRLAQIDLPSGVAGNQLALVSSDSLNRNANQLARHKADLAALRMIPGVESAAAVDALPFNGNDWMVGRIKTNPQKPGGPIASVFNGTPGELKTLGLQFVAGRDFRPDEYIPLGSADGDSGITRVPAVIITEALARRVFPKGNAVGKSLYAGDPNPIRVVGIVRHLLQPDVGVGGHNDYSMLFPMLPDTAAITYVLRTAPQDRARVLKQARDVLYRLDPNRVVKTDTFTHMRAKYFQRDRSMVDLLLASAFGLLLVAALGITGLANFWVQQRTRTIGIRRALGARRIDILRYFQTENFLIVTFGVVLGVILAVGLNLLLMAHYQLPRLPLWYLPVGAVALWILGQLAVLAPALRASHVPPAVAVRSV